jgi:hypothetical protein
VTQTTKSTNETIGSSVDFCSQSLALAFLFAGVAYGLPVKLFPDSHPFASWMSPEILNLYMMVSWMGLAHFIYAYRGQGMTLAKNKSLTAPFAIALSLGALALVGLRGWLGFQLFSFVMWVYFIPHFVKAELHFGNVLDQHGAAKGWAIYWFPALCFTYLTFVLFCPFSWVQNPWFAILVGIAVVAIGLPFGVWKQLQDRRISNYMLLAFFIVAEGMVWATYRKYMDFHFQQGIYVFHIALASFYHYFRSYDFAGRMMRNTKRGASFLIGVAVVNLAVIAVAFTVVHLAALASLAVIFDVAYFTFWVGLHQFSSDVFGYLRNSFKPAPQQASS